MMLDIYLIYSIFIGFIIGTILCVISYFQSSIFGLPFLTEGPNGVLILISVVTSFLTSILLLLLITAVSYIFHGFKNER